MAELFAQRKTTPNKVIKTDKILEDIRNRKKITGSYGMIRNNATGEKIEIRRNTKPTNEPDKTPQTKTQSPNSPEYDYMQDVPREDQQEVYQAERENYQSNSGSGGSMDVEEQHQEDLTPEEVEVSKEELGSTMTQLQDFMLENDIEEMAVLGRMGGDGIEGLSKLLDIENIEDGDDIYEAFGALDVLMDFLDLDSQKFYTTGEVEFCGEECKARRVKNEEAYQKEAEGQYQQREDQQYARATE